MYGSSINTAIVVCSRKGYIVIGLNISLNEGREGGRSGVLYVSYSEEDVRVAAEI